MCSCAEVLFVVCVCDSLTNPIPMALHVFGDYCDGSRGRLPKTIRFDACKFSFPARWLVLFLWGGSWPLTRAFSVLFSQPSHRATIHNFVFAVQSRKLAPGWKAPLPPPRPPQPPPPLGETSSNIEPSSLKARSVLHGDWPGAHKCETQLAKVGQVGVLREPARRVIRRR